MVCFLSSELSNPQLGVYISNWDYYDQSDIFYVSCIVLNQKKTKRIKANEISAELMESNLKVHVYNQLIWITNLVI